MKKHVGISKQKSIQTRSGCNKHKLILHKYIHVHTNRKIQWTHVHVHSYIYVKLCGSGEFNFIAS